MQLKVYIWFAVYHCPFIRVKGTLFTTKSMGSVVSGGINGRHLLDAANMRFAFSLGLRGTRGNIILWSSLSQAISIHFEGPGPHCARTSIPS